jgi:hypothetical protein
LQLGRSLSFDEKQRTTLFTTGHSYQKHLIGGPNPPPVGMAENLRTCTITATLQVQQFVEIALGAKTLMLYVQDKMTYLLISAKWAIWA